MTTHTTTFRWIIAFWVMFQLPSLPAQANIVNLNYYGRRSHEAFVEPSNRWVVTVRPEYADRIQGIRIETYYRSYNRIFEGFDTTRMVFELPLIVSGLKRSVIWTDQGTYTGSDIDRVFDISFVRADRKFRHANLVAALVRESQLFVNQADLKRPVTQLAPEAFPDRISALPVTTTWVADNASYDRLTDDQKAVFEYAARIGRVFLVGLNARAITGHEQLLGIDNTPDEMEALTESLKSMIQVEKPDPTHPASIAMSVKSDPGEIVLPFAPVKFLVIGALYLILVLAFTIYRLKQGHREIRLAYLLPAIAFTVSGAVYTADLSATEMNGKSAWTGISIQYTPNRRLCIDRMSIVGRVPQVISVESPPFELLGDDAGGADRATPRYQWVTTPSSDRIEDFRVFQLSKRSLRVLRMDNQPSPVSTGRLRDNTIMIANLTDQTWMAAEIWDVRRARRYSADVTLPAGERIQVNLDSESPDKWTDLTDPPTTLLQVLGDLGQYAIILRDQPDDRVKVFGLEGECARVNLLAIPVSGYP